MIHMDCRIDKERPPKQNADVDRPLRYMANEDNAEQHNPDQKDDRSPR